MRVPDVVKSAVRNFNVAQLDENTDVQDVVIVPPAKNESSFIFQWGVRIECTLAEKKHVGWICLGSDSCRNNINFILLSHSKTSRASEHLKKAHGVVSDKMIVEVTRKRSRETENERLQLSQLYNDDPGRMRLLIETLRIVNNNLAFKFVEYDESRVLNDIAVKPIMQVSLNAKMIAHTVIELFASTKREMMSFIAACKAKSKPREIRAADNVPCMSLVVDFWTLKETSTKFLGLRVYFADEKWKFRSLLLGVRHFNPDYCERGRGIRGPLKRWIEDICKDFGISMQDLFGSTSDAGPDIKYMMNKGLNLPWEWCVPHMTNAAAKMAFGIVSDTSKSKNPHMTQLISAIVSTVCQVKTRESMGTLFADMCDFIGESRIKGLVSFRAHRFMGLERVIRRILLLWDALMDWHRGRCEAEAKKGKGPPIFKLDGRKDELCQILSLLSPVTGVNVLAQTEECNQVDVTIALYKLRAHTLDVSKNLKDYRSTRENPKFYPPTALTPLVQDTRALLHDTFHRNFFRRYTHKNTGCAFVFEMQLLLHPSFKDLSLSMGKMVRLCNAGKSEGELARLLEKLTRSVTDKVKNIMRSLMPPAQDHVVTQSADFSMYSDDVLEFATNANDYAPQAHERVVDERVDEELSRWATDPNRLLPVSNPDHRSNDIKPETILSFWKRQSETGAYSYLPSVARIVFSLPSSSAQLERDFGVCGMMMTPQRSAMSPYNLEMCMFLNRNREFVDITQCSKIKKEDVKNHIPSNVLVDFEEVEDDDIGEILTQLFSDIEED